jgi:hypothetical protein
MKKLIISLFLISLVSFIAAEEISLGLVVGIEGNSLILVDGEKFQLPNISACRFVTEDNQALDTASFTFPFTATVITPDNFEDPTIQTTVIKIHKFYEIEEGRLVERTSTK